VSKLKKLSGPCFKILVSNYTFGLSGQNGRIQQSSSAGMPGNAKARGQLCVFPRIYMYIRIFDKERLSMI